QLHDAPPVGLLRPASARCGAAARVPYRRAAVSLLTAEARRTLGVLGSPQRPQRNTGASSRCRLCIGIEGVRGSSCLAAFAGDGVPATRDATRQLHNTEERCRREAYHRREPLCGSTCSSVVKERTSAPSAPQR